MWVALVPMAMLFLAFVSAYVVRHTMGTQWTPGAVPGILWLNTAILFASSALLERARGVLRAGRPVRPWLGATLGAGLLFVGGQLVAWQELRAAGYGFSATPHSSFFYMMTGAHAVHVAGGLLGLGIATAWPAASPRRGVALQVLAIYWHFLAVLWLGLFALLGLWR
jgi:cytochrome c oxidase subunit 3